MNTNRVAALMAIAAGLILLIAPRPARAAGFFLNAGQVPTTSSLASEPQSAAAAGENDFAGLDLTGEQKAQMAKIHQAATTHKAVVAKHTKLTLRQKDALL